VKKLLVRLTVAMLVIGLSISMVGCQSIAEKATEAAVENATGIDIEKSGDEVTIKGEDGTELTASSDGELPEGFPTDVPVYEGAIVSSIKTDNGFSVVIEAQGDVVEIFDWYKDELTSEGWKIVTEMKVEDGGALVSEKGNETAQVTLGVDSSDASKTTITIFTGTKQ